MLDNLGNACEGIRDGRNDERRAVASVTATSTVKRKNFPNFDTETIRIL